ncbi:MAG: hypothetical protein ABR612_13670 [Chromatocurvus sp.]
MNIPQSPPDTPRWTRLRLGPQPARRRRHRTAFPGHSLHRRQQRARLNRLVLRTGLTRNSIGIELDNAGQLIRSSGKWVLPFTCRSYPGREVTVSYDSTTYCYHEPCGLQGGEVDEQQLMRQQHGIG